MHYYSSEMVLASLAIIQRRKTPFTCLHAMFQPLHSKGTPVPITACEQSLNPLGTAVLIQRLSDPHSLPPPVPVSATYHRCYRRHEVLQLHLAS